ncbi:MAG: hypothetical protein K1X88_12560 [Nannocystaceae bacterium]|nr:hypothetical protein [Nannocystaceae bacterium]
MVDLLNVPWTPRGQTRENPIRFWGEAALEDQLAFANTWGSSSSAPREHFNKFKSAATLDVLNILQQIGEHRSNILEFGFPPNRSSANVDQAIVDDTFDVVKYEPRHCGGWLGLLKVRAPNPAQRVIVVDRPTHSGMWFVRWPPAPGRGFRQIYTWLTQTITIDDAVFDVGNSWTPNNAMLSFIAGQRATGGPSTDGRAHAGFESMVSTIRAMVYESFDKRLIDFYIRHLRGHGPTEAGTVHHFFQLISGSGEADATGLKSLLDTTLQQQLLAFPAAWNLTRSPSDLWPAAVSGHVEHWRVGMGNHRAGQEWLKQIVTARKTEWDAAAILDVIGGVRETQRTIGVTVSRALTTTQTVAEEVATTIEEANRVGTTSSWSQALSTAQTRLHSLSQSNSSGTTTTTGTTGTNATSVMVGGETGALEELLLGKINGEVTNTMTTQLSNQIARHQSMETTTLDSNSTTTGTTTTTTLTAMRERTLSLARSFRTSVTRAVQVATGLSTNVNSVIAVDANRNAQKAQVVSGLDVALRAINDTLANL